MISDIDYEFIEKDISKLPLPYGFKFNAFEQIPEGWKPDGNNTSLLGRRKEMTPDKFLEVCTKYSSLGAKLVGGCCEITPKSNQHNPSPDLGHTMYFHQSSQKSLQELNRWRSAIHRSL